MNKTKYLFIMALAVFSLVLLGSRSYAQSNAWVEGSVEGDYPVATSSFEASWLLGHQVVSPDYDGYLGQITDVLIDRCDGRVAMVVLSDTPGFGLESLAVPFSRLERVGENTFELSFAGLDVPLVNPEREYYRSKGDRYAEFLARNRSTIGVTTIPAAIDPLWADSVYQFYGATPYWTEGKTAHPDIVSYRETRMLGAQVQSADGAMFGRINDLVIDYPEGRVAFVVLDEIPGRTGAMVAVPFGELSMNGNAFVLNVTEDRFVSAPAFEIADLDRAGRAEEIYSYYGVSPYFSSCEAAPSSCGPQANNFSGMESAAVPPMPSEAKPGECYAKVWIPAQYKTVTEQVLVRAASEKVETIPAKYESVQEKVMVKPAHTETEQVPAQYKTVQEQVLVEPAHREWRPGRGAVERMDSKTGQIMCLVEIPAKYKTVEKQVLVTPATTRSIEVPAQYEMRTVSKMVEPAHENRIEIPAEYKTVTNCDKVSDGYWTWKKVEGCHAEENSAALK